MHVLKIAALGALAMIASVGSAWAECNLDQMVHVVNGSNSTIVDLYAYNEAGIGGEAENWLTDGPLYPGGDIYIHPNDGSGATNYYIDAFDDAGLYGGTVIDLCLNEPQWLIYEGDLSEEGDY